MLNCRDVARIVASDELDGMGPIMRLRFRFHLLICKGCRQYAQQIHTIGAAARARLASVTGDEESLARLEKAILDSAFGTPREEV